MPDLRLYPTPRHLSLSGGTCAVPAAPTVHGCPPSLVATLATLGLADGGADAWIHCRIDPAVTEAEGHVVEVQPEGIRVAARTEAGLRWGLVTVGQLLATGTGSIPCLRIEDHPCFAHRGVMLDISRDRVPTMATLRDLVRRLHLLKLNRIQLYVEHTVAYPGHEAVWRNADPITLEELAELGAFAAAYGITLDANQNCLGHWERWLRVPAYADLGEISKGTAVRPGWYTDPSTLYPGDPRAFRLVCELLEQQAAVCPGSYVNIGCDEPWELGQGRSKERCEREGSPKVFSEWVSKVAGHVKNLGKRPQFWCDPHPREDDSLPKDLIALVWGYEADEDFATRTRAHRKQGRPVWVAPGTGCWNSTTGRSDTHQGNLAGARDQGLAEGAEGFLCTVWGDNGHLQPWPMTLFGLAQAAQASWGHGAFDPAAAGLRMFGSADLGMWLDAVGRSDAVIRSGRGGSFQGKAQGVRNQTAFFIDMSRNVQDPSGPGDLAHWQDTAKVLDDLARSQPRVDALIDRECAHGIALAQWSARRAILRRGQITPEQRQSLAEAMIDLVASHRETWLARCRYGGLEDSCAVLKRHVKWH